MTKISRREFLKLSAAFGASLALGLPAPDAPQEVAELPSPESAPTARGTNALVEAYIGSDEDGEWVKLDGVRSYSLSRGPSYLNTPALSDGLPRPHYSQEFEIDYAADDPHDVHFHGWPHEPRSFEFSFRDYTWRFRAFVLDHVGERLPGGFVGTMRVRVVGDPELTFRGERIL